MQSFLEAPFTINGVKSSVQCLTVQLNPNPNLTASNSFHYHNYIELIYSLTPGAILLMGSQRLELIPGDLAVINSRVPHTFTANMPTQYICIKFSPYILYSDEQSQFEFKYALPFLLPESLHFLFHDKEITGTNISSLVQEMMREWEAKETGYELILKANIQRIFVGILRYWYKKNVVLSNIHLTDAMKQALFYLSEHFRTATERDLAQVCGLSYNHFSYTFKQAVGRNFKDYVTMLRLQEAENLLLSTDMSITDIALDIGFSTTSHFISRFKAQKHYTPSQYRKKLRRNITPEK